MYKVLVGIVVFLSVSGDLCGMKSLFSSSTLQKEFKDSVMQYILNQANENAKDFIKKALNSDLEIQYKNLQEDPDGYETYLDNLDWLLFQCIELANNRSTRSSYDSIAKAISSHQLINCF